MVNSLEVLRDLEKAVELQNIKINYNLTEYNRTNNNRYVKDKLTPDYLNNLLENNTQAFVKNITDYCVVFLSETIDWTMFGWTKDYTKSNIVSNNLSNIGINTITYSITDDVYLKYINNILDYELKKLWLTFVNDVFCLCSCSLSDFKVWFINNYENNKDRYNSKIDELFGTNYIKIDLKELGIIDESYIINLLIK